MQIVNDINHVYISTLIGDSYDIKDLQDKGRNGQSMHTQTG